MDDKGLSFSQLTIDRSGGSKFVVFIDGHQVGVASRSMRGMWRPGPVLRDRFPNLRRHYHMAADLQGDVREEYAEEVDDV